MAGVRIEPGTRVLITGASRGIGRHTAEAFAARGCTVGLVARSEDQLEQVLSALPGEGHQALPADVGDADAIGAAVERFGVVDVAVANAGRADYMPFRDMELETIEAMTRLNWLGTVYTVKAVLPGMLERRRGQLVLVSSGAGLRSFPSGAVYGATKAAQRGLGEALWHELDGTGVSVTLVYPGEVRTSIHEGKEDLPEWRRHSREAEPEPLAEQIVAAVESDAPAVYYPSAVRALRVAHGVSPRLGDRLLRRMRGPSAAPRR
jgi:short-subunit dehydrogenase